MRTSVSKRLSLLLCIYFCTVLVTGLVAFISLQAYYYYGGTSVFQNAFIETENDIIYGEGDGFRPSIRAIVSAPGVRTIDDIEAVLVVGPLDVPVEDWTTTMDGMYLEPSFEPEGFRYVFGPPTLPVGEYGFYVRFDAPGSFSIYGSRERESPSFALSQLDPDELGRLSVIIDCNRNQIPDDLDIAEGREEDCNSNGIPDSCDISYDFAQTMAQDDCASAQPVTTVDAGVVYEGTTEGASPSANLSACGSSSGAPDVWFTYTPAETGIVSIQLCGSSFDTTLAVYTGCPTQGESPFECNDDFCGLQSQVTFEGEAGVEYKIRVSGYNGRTGDFVLTLNGPEAEPIRVNDDNGNGIPDECDQVVTPTPTPTPTPLPLDPERDEDRDGLTNGEEDTIGTNPRIKDTDEDGFEDGVEVAVETDPLDPDDPADKTDNDNDGIPDFGGLGDNDPTTSDSDGDRFADSLEIVRGTDPNDSSEFPTMGDANMDGRTEFTDAVAIFNIFLGTFDPADFAAEEDLDLNRDGRVDIIDGVLGFNFFLGNIQQLPFP